jgi:VanZ family protein
LIIFSFSSDKISSQRSSRIIGPIVLWLFPNLPKKTVDKIVFEVRKGAHVTEFAILAMLLWRARNRPSRLNFRPWNWSEARFAWLLVVLYAATDEFHQTFVPNREGMARDVLIDSAGAALGLILLWRFCRWRKYC